jgi:multisubunit Na+/H+ antiporter MnhB subunit
MEIESPDPKVSFELKAAVVVAVVTVVGFLIFLPASRRFLLGIGIAVLICVAIGVVVAAILYLWHRHKPVKEEDVNSKRPLGLE